MAISHDEAGIDALLRPALRTVAEIERHDELPQKMRDAEAAFFTPRPRRTRSQLDQDLRMALERRSGRLDPFPGAERSRRADPGRPGLGL